MGEKGKKMPKYIERDSFVEWLKNIPLKDLSDGLGLCRVIMEDDFKRAIKNIPESIIHDYEVVVRCRDCKHWGDQDGKLKNSDGDLFARCKIHNYLIDGRHTGWCPTENDFCSCGERKGGDD